MSSNQDNKGGMINKARRNTLPEYNHFVVDLNLAKQII